MVQHFFHLATSQQINPLHACIYTQMHLLLNTCPIKSCQSVHKKLSAINGTEKFTFLLLQWTWPSATSLLPPALMDSHVAADTIFNSIKDFWKALNRVLMKKRQIWPQYLSAFPIFSSTSFLDSVTPSYKKYANLCFKQSACSNTGTATVKNIH